MVLEAPFKTGFRVPVDLAVDQTGANLYVAARSDAAGACGAGSTLGCVLILDSHTARVRALVPLPGVPGDLRIDSGLGLLFVVIPSQNALMVIDVRAGVLLDGSSGRPDRTIASLPQITSLALDSLRHTLYVSQLGGEVTIIDVATGKPSTRIPLTGAGLASIATARGLAYGVNTATHELAVLDPGALVVNSFFLSQEPIAVSASEASGVVYVLSSRADVILQIDPSDGSELGQVLLADESGGTSPTRGELSTLPPRLALDGSDDTVYATMPEAHMLATVAPDQFPALVRQIPFLAVVDQNSDSATADATVAVSGDSAGSGTTPDTDAG